MLSLIENAVCWRSARWIFEISGLKSEPSNCCAMVVKVIQPKKTFNLSFIFVTFWRSNFFFFTYEGLSPCRQPLTTQTKTQKPRATLTGMPGLFPRPITLAFSTCFFRSVTSPLESLAVAQSEDVDLVCRKGQTHLVTQCNEGLMSCSDHL